MGRENFDDYIYDILNDYDIFKGWYRGIDTTHVTFLLQQATPVNFSDSENEAIELCYRFDIWSKNEKEQSEYYNEILEILESENFIWLKTLNDVEIDTSLYHTCIFVNKEIDKYDYYYI